MERTRRGVLAGATGLLVALAGCGGGGAGDGGDGGGPGPATAAPGGTNRGLVTPTPTPDPVPNLTFDGLTVGEREGGLLVTVTVVNDGSESGSGTFLLTVRVGDREFSREQSVSLDTGGRRTFEFSFPETTRAALRADGGVDVDWRA
jgi:hypothetical protein